MWNRHNPSVSHIGIQPDRMRTHVCECCGGDASHASGFIYQDGEPRGVYILDGTEGHTERSAGLTISLGDWSDDAIPHSRSVMAVEIRRNDEGEVGFRLSDHTQQESESFGRFVTRDEALAAGGLDGFWRITDHIAVDDPRAAAVLAWVGGERDGALG
jgi:hypothetical protein